MLHACLCCWKQRLVVLCSPVSYGCTWWNDRFLSGPSPPWFPNTWDFMSKFSRVLGSYNQLILPGSSNESILPVLWSSLVIIYIYYWYHVVISLQKYSQISYNIWLYPLNNAFLVFRSGYHPVSGAMLSISALRLPRAAAHEEGHEEVLANGVCCKPGHGAFRVSEQSTGGIPNRIILDCDISPNDIMKASRIPQLIINRGRTRVSAHLGLS